VVRSHEALRAASRELIGLVLPPEKGIRLVGVTVSNFEAEAGESEALPLFGAGEAA
jgi:DNA polymerase-4